MIDNYKWRLGWWYGFVIVNIEYRCWHELKMITYSEEWSDAVRVQNGGTFFMAHWQVDNSVLRALYLSARAPPANCSTHCGRCWLRWGCHLHRTHTGWWCLSSPGWRRRQVSLHGLWTPCIEHYQSQSHPAAAAAETSLEKSQTSSAKADRTLESIIDKCHAKKQKHLFLLWLLRGFLVTWMQVANWHTFMMHSDDKHELQSHPARYRICIYYVLTGPQLHWD